MLKYKLAKTSLFVFTIICLFGPLPRALGLFRFRLILKMLGL